MPRLFNVLEEDLRRLLKEPIASICSTSEYLGVVGAVRLTRQCVSSFNERELQPIL